MSYLSTVLASGPSRYWRAADPGGCLLNDIGSMSPTVPLGLTQPLGLPYSGIAADGGSAVGLGGIGRITNLNSLFNLTGNTFSMECWHWPLNLGSLQALELATATQQPLIRFQNSGKYIAAFAGTLITSAHTFAANKWHHLVLTYDHVTLSLYVDGALEITAGLVATAIGNYGVIGLSDEAGGNWGTGALCEIALYTTLLSGPNVLAHFNARENLSDNLVYRGVGSWSGSSGSSQLLDSYVSAVYQNVP